MPSQATSSSSAVVHIWESPLLEKREKWGTPSLFRSTTKDKPALYFPRNVAHPPRVELRECGDRRDVPYFFIIEI
jgi:hypothetical protein